MDSFPLQLVSSSMETDPDSLPDSDPETMNQESLDKLVQQLKAFHSVIVGDSLPQGQGQQQQQQQQLENLSIIETIENVQSLIDNVSLIPIFIQNKGLFYLFEIASKTSSIEVILVVLQTLWDFCDPEIVTPGDTLESSTASFVSMAVVLGYFPYLIQIYNYLLTKFNLCIHLTDLSSSFYSSVSVCSKLVEQVYSTSNNLPKSSISSNSILSLFDKCLGSYSKLFPIYLVKNPAQSPFFIENPSLSTAIEDAGLEMIQCFLNILIETDTCIYSNPDPFQSIFDFLENFISKFQVMTVGQGEILSNSLQVVLILESKAPKLAGFFQTHSSFFPLCIQLALNQPFFANILLGYIADQLDSPHHLNLFVENCGLDLISYLIMFDAKKVFSKATIKNFNSPSTLRLLVMENLSLILWKYVVFAPKKLESGEKPRSKLLKRFTSHSFLLLKHFLDQCRNSIFNQYCTLEKEWQSERQKSKPPYPIELTLEYLIQMALPQTLFRFDIFLASLIALSSGSKRPILCDFLKNHLNPVSVQTSIEHFIKLIPNPESSSIQSHSLLVQQVWKMSYFGEKNVLDSSNFHSSSLSTIQEPSMKKVRKYS